MPTKVFSNLRGPVRGDRTKAASQPVESCQVLPVVIEEAKQLAAEPTAEVMDASPASVEEATVEPVPFEMTAEELPDVAPVKPKRRRARKSDGQFQADDPTTAVNEAFVEG